MLIKTAIGEVSGLRYMVSKLEIESSLAKRVLLSTEFMVSAQAIEAELSLVERMVSALNNPAQSSALGKVSVKLMQMRDINSSIKNLAGGNTLDDIELYEVKNLAILAYIIKTILAEAGIDIVILPELSKAISILDPENTKIPSFYIYDAYSPALALIRKQIKIKRPCKCLFAQNQFW